VSPDAIENAIGLSARFYGRSHDALIRVYDAAGNVIASLGELSQNDEAVAKGCLVGNYPSGM